MYILNASSSHLHTRPDSPARAGTVGDPRRKIERDAKGSSPQHQLETQGKYPNIRSHGRCPLSGHLVRLWLQEAGQADIPPQPQTLAGSRCRWPLPSQHNIHRCSQCGRGLTSEEVNAQAGPPSRPEGRLDPSCVCLVNTSPFGQVLSPTATRKTDTTSTQWLCWLPG